MTADSLLSRLEGVRRTGDGRWIARCPAHADRSPSLSIREVGDGRTLIHCFSGCEPADVLAALGLDWSAISPPRDRSAPGRPLRRERVALAADALRCLEIEVAIVAIAAGDLARGKPLSEQDRSRLLLAAGRIMGARDVCDA